MFLSCLQSPSRKTTLCRSCFTVRSGLASVVTWVVGIVAEVYPWTTSVFSSWSFIRCVRVWGILSSWILLPFDFKYLAVPKRGWRLEAFLQQRLTSEASQVQDRLANEKHLLVWASVSFLLVQRQATFAYLVSQHRRRFWIAMYLHVYIERLFSHWRRLFWKGSPLLRMGRGAGCWQPIRRLPPAATSNRLPSMRSAPPFDAFVRQRKNGNKK